MKIAVIIPVHDGERFLEEAVDSMLNQTLPPHEIIIVDDGSLDRTPAIIKDLSDRHANVKPYFLESNRGVSFARNFGVERAQSDWCLFFDADDVASPGLLESYSRQLNEWGSENKMTDMIFCATQQIDEHGKEIAGPSRFYQVEPKETQGYLLVRNPIISASGVMIKRNVFRLIGGFNAELRYSEDWDLWLKVSMHHSVRYLDYVLVKVRRHSGNASSKLNKMLDGEKQVLSQFSLNEIEQAINARNLPADRNAIDFASVALRIGYWKEGMERLKLVKDGSDSLFFHMGLFALKQARLQEALNHFDHAIRLNPNHLAAQNNKACCLWLLDSKLEAENLFRHINLQFPEYMDASRNLERILRFEQPPTIDDFNFTWRELRKVLTHYSE